MKTAFNSNFYLTTAAVIPVLYVALIVQANAARDMLLRLDHAMHEKIKRESQGSIVLVLMILGLAAACIIWLASVAIVIFGIVGETASILSLYNQSDSETIRLLVLVSTILLLIVTTIGPVLTVSFAFTRPMIRWAKAFFQVLRRLLSADHTSNNNGHRQPAAPTNED
jgi:hypothetical protein